MPIPTETVGSLPRPMKLQDAYQRLDDGEISFDELQAVQDEAAKAKARAAERYATA